jgi:transglutaminase-like putative cysteine protease
VNAFLRATSVIDHDHPEVRALATELSDGTSDPTVTTKRCFEWVRDEIRHSGDFRMNPTTCDASEVLRHRTGYCYAKSHLLAALLRANSIPAGFCYQRLARNGRTAPYVLHGLNAVHLPEFGWYRIDARGNKANVNAQFVPPTEQLAWPIAVEGEADLPEIWPDPLPVIVETLRKHDTYDRAAENLPDIPLIHPKQQEA